tara:strand:- start:1243 stop:1596 length:354 start_codon:yes stop_codon:yes gene_type:complete
MATNTMNRPELLKLHETLCNEARQLMKVKNHDYAGGKHENIPFANFTRVESMGITTTEKGLLVRMTDKMSRLSTFCQEGHFEVSDESLKDTIIDVINYGVLLYGYVQSKSPDPDQET